MENEFLDKVEDNAAIQTWSEAIQWEKCDSLAKGYISELWDFTRISVTQNSLQELKEIWDQWNKEVKQLFYSSYGDLPYLLNIKVDKHLFRALAQFWNPAYSCFTFGGAHLDMKKKFDVFALSIYGLVVFPKALGHVDEAVTDLFDRLDKGVTPVPTILAETFRSLNGCRKIGKGRFIGCAQLLLAWFYSHFWKVENVFYRGFSENYSPLKEIVAIPRQDDIPEEKWIEILQNLREEDIEWRAPWMLPDEILYRCGNFDWVPLLGIWGAVGYAPLLVLRQFRLRQFIPATQ
ncbi:hypothetical protein Gogos_022391 [Gossypium gossypioides]|uniref:DUF7745 domain-containing protein n=1 Tax=Gossypium gossypioides TaxID=34282 RepID=A0A7J9D0H7_GOSGO|nr:hypothetical protein [Gossypium gossypioides]